jgi:hypothetical protein
MKKILLIVFLVFIISGNCFANPVASQMAANAFTEGRVNGRLILIDEEFDGHSAFYYIVGVVDGLYFARPKWYAETYPGTTKSDIYEAVKKYYEDNPLERSRPIIEVILAGCK